MRKMGLRTCSLLLVGLLFVNWGPTGHYKISYSSTSFLPKEMIQFKSWSAFLAQHSSDADDRKKTDPTEGNKHYIDIDNYADYVKKNKIIENIDSALVVYGAEFVNKNGILPWATYSTYTKLVNSMKIKDWENAKIIASDLGHYVADGFMPLHITNNFNGGLTNQKGIHARYEITMIDSYSSEIKYDSMEIKPIKDVQSYVFNYLYSNYQFKDSLLQADQIAFDIAGKSYSEMYYQSLWSNTKHFTLPLFENASKAFACLMYTAWIEAGKPKYIDKK